MDRFERGTGIVCEYNPFHKGHAYQIESVKNMGAEFVVCAMSGDFTQRGEPSFQDKYVRAENAVRNGADIVLEIPFPFCSLGAEGFAMAGVSILENSGLCSDIAFGSECADVSKLIKIADLLDKSFYKSVIQKQKESPSLSYASARETLISEKLGKENADIIRNPNDILAVEYIKAMTFLSPIAVKRTTPRGGFDENFASSSYIRRTFFEDGNRNAALGGLPENYSFEKIYDGNGVFYTHLLLSLMQKTPEYLSEIAEVSGGLEHSIVTNAAMSENYDELCRLLASKTLTDAKIRRMLLFAFFGVTKKMAKDVPHYTAVLAVSDVGRKMLKKYAGDRRIVVASRIAEIKKDKEAKEQYDFARKAYEVVEKCRKVTL